ncbi:MAG: glycosyltransferase family 2 protein, partial [Clostridiales bacterium]|nr:glycosyltransferase family 2 protein [Clostridiales bacterium]
MASFSSPKISVILLQENHNDFSCFSETLKSLSLQNSDEVEFLYANVSEKEKASQVFVLYGKKDIRFRFLLCKENSLWASVCHALENARGEYLLFTFAGITYQENAFLPLLSLVKENQNDVIHFPLETRYAKETASHPFHPKENAFPVTTRPIKNSPLCIDWLTCQHCPPAMFDKVIRTCIVQK